MEDELPVEMTEWWVPGHPETRVNGALTFGPEGASVMLLDQLPDVRASGRFSKPALLGQTFDGTPLTLLHPMVTSHTHRTTPEGIWFRATVESQTLLRGHHVDDPDSLMVTRAIVRLAGLRDICLQRWENKASEWIPFVTPGLGARHIKLRGRGSLLFRQHQEKTEDRYRRAVEIGVEVMIYPKTPLTLVDLDAQWLAPLESFTVLAARGPTQLEYFKLVLVDPNGVETEMLVETRAPALAAKPLDEYTPLIPLAALDGNAQRFIYRWWKIYNDLGPAAGFMRATLSGEMFLEQKLLMGMSFAEGYHREIHGPKGLSHLKRIEALIARAHKTVPEAPGLESKLAKDLIITRNAIAHLNRGLDGRALEGEDLVYGVARLRLIIEINLLLDLGVKTHLAADMVLRSYDRGRQIPLADYRDR